MKKLAAILAVCVALATGCVATGSGPAESSRSDDEAAQYNLSLGVGYLRQGRYELAMTKLEKALSQDSSLAPAHSALALVYEHYKEYDKADDHYRKALRLSKRSPDTLNNYGAFLCRQKRADEAVKYFEGAADNPRYATPAAAWTNAGVCIRQHDGAKAEEYFRKALVADPKFPDALWQMADLSFVNGEFLSARAFLGRLHEVVPATPQTLRLGMRTESALGDEAAARRYALRLSKEFPDASNADGTN